MARKAEKPKKKKKTLICCVYFRLFGGQVVRGCSVFAYEDWVHAH